MVTESKDDATAMLLLDYWKPVVEYEQVYEVSVTGRIRRLDSGYMLNGTDDGRGYRQVRLKGRDVARASCGRQGIHRRAYGCPR
jgi:hypothetical protein